jgi:hypothetical protein
MYAVFIKAANRANAMGQDERATVFAGNQIWLAQGMMRSTRTGFLFRYFTFGQCHGLNPVQCF